MIVLALGLLVASCGGSDSPKTTDDPTATASVSVTPTPTPTPSPTPTAEPLSPFEDKAPVKAARAWADALGRAVNSNTFTTATLGAVATPAGIKASQVATAFDTQRGYQWPGPQPFTPVSVQVQGGTARIASCFFVKGWAIDPKTGKLAQRNVVGPILIVLKKVAGTWLFDQGQQGTADCGGVTVRGVKW